MCTFEYFINFTICLVSSKHHMKPEVIDRQFMAFLDNSMNYLKHSRVQLEIERTSELF